MFSVEKQKSKYTLFCIIIEMQLEGFIRKRFLTTGQTVVGGSGFSNLLLMDFL